MANPTIGHIQCPLCKVIGRDDCTGEVRRYATGTKKLYWHCQCGQIRPSSADAQLYINENTVFIGDNGTPLPPVTGEKSVNGNLPVNDEKQKKPRSFLDKFLFDDETE